MANVQLLRRLEDCDNSLHGEESSGDEVNPPSAEEVRLYSFQIQKLKKIKAFYVPFAGRFILTHNYQVVSSNSHIYFVCEFRCRNSFPSRPPILKCHEIWCYNTACNTWKIIKRAGVIRMPCIVASTSLAMYNNMVISHGGCSYPRNLNVLVGTYILTAKDKLIIDRLDKEGTPPLGNNGAAMVIFENYMYVVGGCCGSATLCDIDRMELLTRSWENLYSTAANGSRGPIGRSRHKIAIDGENIYVLGGCTDDTLWGLEILPTFNIQSKQWYYVQTLSDPSTIENRGGYPTGSIYFGFIQRKMSHGDIEVFIAGGIFSPRSDIWKLNLNTKQWTCIEVMPPDQKPNYFKDMVDAGNGCIYLIYGNNINNIYSSKDDDDSLFKIWIDIPKLSDMCWDAIMELNPNLCNFNRATLAKAGIPERFASCFPEPPAAEKVDKNDDMNMKHDETCSFLCSKETQN